MSRTVLSVGYPLFPVSSASGGGAEQILQLLDSALVNAGHRSIVIAAKGSNVLGELVATLCSAGEITEEVRRYAQACHQERIQEVLEREEIDLIHFHGLDFLSYRPLNKLTPQLATLHLPLDWYPADLFHQQGLAMNCVSSSQALSHAEALRLPVVPNGIDLNRFQFSAVKKKYLLWLGRVCPEKGADIALRVAHSLDLPLIVAGPVHPFGDHRAYFDRHIVPQLDQDRRYIGAVDIVQRAELLSNARCVLLPALAAETSSLVAMEAAASGTPVVAFSAGALPEIVEHGTTGWIVHSEEEMWDGVRRSAEIRPEPCRRAAERRFDATEMAAKYFALYQSLVNLHHSNG